MTGARYPRAHITDDEVAWLEQASAPDPGPRARCCARCKRGVVPGQFPCGRALNCACHDKPQKGSG